jgi:hypothetical protein
MDNNRLATVLLRIGLAFVLVYASVEIYIHPENFLKYIPKLILQSVPINHFLDSFGIIEVMLAVWLLSGWKGHYPSFLCVLMMVGIVAFNMEHFNVLFRNVAIAFGGMALVFLELKKTKTPQVSLKDKKQDRQDPLVRTG